MNILKKLVTPRQKVLIRSILHSVYRLKHGLPKVEASLDYLFIQHKGYDTFFGYYDITPFNSSDEILYLKRRNNSNEVEICLNDSNDLTKEKVLATSKAWNWQQGSRLRWFPGCEEHIVFNTFKNNKYGATVINKNGQIVRNFKKPLYDISADGKLGLTLNFERLGVMRPGYGYTCKSYIPCNLQNESIDVIDLNSDNVVDSVTYSAIASVISQQSTFDNCYINHLAFSPDGNCFLFFWIEIVNGYHQASLLVYDMLTKTIIPLELKEKVSHYVWLDNKNILCTSYLDSLTCRYFVYNLKNRTKKPYCSECLREDGHPSVDKDSFILTDTYPNRIGFQSLYLVDSEKDIKETLFKVYMRPVANGEKRTDLHPRFNISHSKICIDINKEGNREIVILNRNKNE